MRLKFSQRRFKEKYEKRFRKLINFVKGSRSTPDLCIKIFFYKKPCRSVGRYRHYNIHGFYEKEWEELMPKITSIITLKLSQDVSDEEFIKLFAHEFKHYLDFNKFYTIAISKGRFKKWEVRASKFAEKMKRKWREKNLERAESLS